jgi:hypothetical protein
MTTNPDPPPPPAPPTGITVRTKIFPLAFLLLLTRPNVSIDGGPPMRTPWGDLFVPLPAGTHSVRCSAPYLWYRHMGDATMEVEVPPSGTVTIQWRSPWLVFLAGKWTTIAPS